VSLFSAPKIPAPQPAPTEDPAVTAARQQAQVQADASLTRSIQDDLRRKTQARLQHFGLVANDITAGSGRPNVTAGFIAGI
jgi:hypothetical protein